MERRDFLHAIALGAAWPVADGWITAETEALGIRIHTQTATDDRGFRALDPAAAALVSAACDRIIPADETPGAVAAGVPRFIDTILSDWEAPADRARFVAGLSELDRRSIARDRRRFVECSNAEKDAVLLALDRELTELSPGDRASHWFARLRFLTIYGYCTSEAGVRQELGEYPMPGRYDGDAPYVPRRSPGTVAADGGAQRK